MKKILLLLVTISGLAIPLIGSAVDNRSSADCPSLADALNIPYSYGQTYDELRRKVDPYLENCTNYRMDLEKYKKQLDEYKKSGGQITEL